MQSPQRLAALADARRQPPAAGAAVGLALLLGGLCAITAVSAASDQGAFSEYLLRARQCAELHDCPSQGGSAGALPLFHGTLWIRLLAYSVRSGADLVSLRPIMVGSWLLSMPVTFFAFRRYLGTAAAALALGLYFPVILVLTDITMFTYTNLLPLPFALYFAAIAAFAESRRTMFPMLGSVALAAAVSAELGSIVMVPFHLILVALLSARPVSAVIATGLAFAVPYGLESADAAREIVRQVPTLRFAVAVAIGGGLAVVGARLARAAVGRVSMAAAERVRLVMTAALIYAAATICLTCLLLMNGVPAPRYLLPVAFPFLYLVADGLRSLSLRATVLVAALEGTVLLMLIFATEGLELLQVPVAVIVLVYGFVRMGQLARRGPGSTPRSVWPVLAICVGAAALAAADLVIAARRGTAQTLTLGDAEGVVRTLYAAGYRYGDVLAGLQGPAADDLSPLLTERDPDAFRAPALPLAPADFSLLVVKVPDDLVARTHGVLAALPAGAARSVLVVRDEAAYLDWTRMRRCRWSSDGQPTPVYTCAEPRAEPLPRNWPYVAFTQAAPAATPVESLSRWGVRYEVPVRTRGRSVAHIIRTANEWPAQWRIVAVHGVDFEGALPGAEVRLPDTREGTGVVVLEYTPAVPGDLPWVWLPHVIEVSEENQHLLEPLRSPRGT